MNHASPDIVRIGELIMDATAVAEMELDDKWGIDTSVGPAVCWTQYTPIDELRAMASTPEEQAMIDELFPRKAE